MQDDIDYFPPLPVSRGIAFNYEPNPDLYRLIVQRMEDDWFCMHLGNHAVRMVASKDLPEDIKVKLAIVEAYSGSIKFKRVNYRSDSVYVSPFPAEFDDVGWAVDINGSVHYCFIVSRSLIDELRGEMCDDT